MNLEELFATAQGFARCGNCRRVMGSIDAHIGACWRCGFKFDPSLALIEKEHLKHVHVTVEAIVSVGPDLVVTLRRDDGSTFDHVWPDVPAPSVGDSMTITGVL